MAAPSLSPIPLNPRRDEAYYLDKAERLERWAEHFSDHEMLRDSFLAQAAGAREIAGRMRAARGPTGQ
jgi:hypothetical protein